MTLLDTVFYFRIEYDSISLPHIYIYERRLTKRWYQREYKEVGSRMYFASEDGEAVPFAQALLADYLERQARQRHAQDVAQQYSAFTPIPPE